MVRNLYVIRNFFSNSLVLSDAMKYIQIKTRIIYCICLYRYILFHLNYYYYHNYFFLGFYYQINRRKTIKLRIYYLLIPINFPNTCPLLFLVVSITLLSLSVFLWQFVSFSLHYNQRTSPYNFQFLESTDVFSSSCFQISLLFSITRIVGR